MNWGDELRKWIFSELKRLFAEEHMIGTNGALCGKELNMESDIGTSNVHRVTCLDCMKIHMDN
jgi:hypothetical protein